MKRRKPFRPLTEIEGNLNDLLEWQAGYKSRLEKYEDRSAVIEVTTRNVTRHLADGDPDYEFYRNIFAEDAKGVIWLADKQIGTLQKEYRKVSRFLARQAKKTHRES